MLTRQTPHPTPQVMKNKQLLGYRALFAALLTFATGAAAQETSTAAPASGAKDKDEPVFELSPFEVTSEGTGYTGATTLAGNHLNTEVRDIGNAVTVITSQFLKDIGATDNQTFSNTPPTPKSAASLVTSWAAATARWWMSLPISPIPIKTPASAA